ncbi:cuticle protein 18.6-like isoform X2 [Thrips palmi]|uniref:Cuticle protein 18.6-like isoform X2 n=1 Tax=Thrips palmi TaxID=161013 RepID=A0A6P8YZZ5_THRPL|nr:cuticle protein 18.6-like isoform X2 [Thrips palmi]
MQSAKVAVVMLAVLAVAAAQYGHHGHAESYASVNQLSSEKHEEYKHAEPVYIKHEYKQPEPVYIKHEYKQPEPVYIKHEVPVKHEYKHAEPEYKHEEVEVDYHSHPKYEFKYGVEDHHTGDNKDQKEERDGDVVKGEYSLLQPDGRKRIVHYTASKHGGFNAIVSYSGHAIHPEVKKAEPVHGHY